MGIRSLPEQPDTKSPVSVIIPAYMAAKTIGRALASIAAQRVLPSEIIVIDDGSEDSTVAVATKWQDSHKDIGLKILRQQHKGAGAARNMGLEEASSVYVAFLDADDEWLPDKLGRSLEELENTNSILVSHNYILNDGKGREFPVNKCDKNFRAAGNAYVNLYKKGYLATSAIVARRDRLLAAGGFDESLPTAQDFALWLSVLSEPDARFHVFADTLILYHITEGSISSHTERRLHCCLRIAKQFRPTLKGKTTVPLFAFWYRILSVHYEALRTYLDQKRVFATFSIVLRFPVNLLMLTFSKNNTDNTHES
jgi:teichuronic acid biosynthesis glycosyltransferase TuaG